MKNVVKIKKRSDIQAYRGIAVLTVIGYHLNSEIFPYGYLGVDVFFVISGFVISNIIYSDLSQKKFSMKDFYLRRIKRIVPSLLSFIIFTQISIFFFQDSQHIFQTTKGNLFSLIFISNIYFSQTFNYFEIDSAYNFIINLWSLSVEEQFYIFFPLFALISFKYKAKTQYYIYFLLFVISVIFNLEVIFNVVPLLQSIFISFSNYIFYSPFSRLWQFLLGIFAMLLNQYVKKNFKLTTHTISTVYLGLFFLICFNYFEIPIKLYTLIVIFVFFILLIFELEVKKNNYLSNFLFFTGNISYSLYLFHQPIFASIRNFEYYSQLTSYLTLNKISGVLATIVLIYFVSYLNYLLIENKFRYKTNTKLTSNKSFAFLFAFTLIFLSIGLFTEGYSFREQKKISIQKNTELKFIPGTNSIKIDGEPCLNRYNIDESCKFNQDNKIDDNKIYFLGDSVINSLISGFVENKQLKGYEIIDLTKGSCPLLLNYCNFNEESEFYNQLKDVNNSIFVIGGTYEKFDVNEKLKKDLSSTFEFLGKQNKVILISPFPSPDVNLKMYERLNRNNYVFDYQSWSLKTRDINSIIFEVGNATENILIVDIEELFCENKKCKFTNPNYFYFTDHQHFSYFGAEIVSEFVLDKFFQQ